MTDSSFEHLFGQKVIPVSYGYGSREPADKEKAARAKADKARDLEVFCWHLELVLRNQELILTCPEYFFVIPSFASVSWPYVSGDGPVCLGYLLIGFRTETLTGKCPDCGGKVLVVNFGGSPLSGMNSWSGCCLQCRAVKTGSYPTRNHEGYRPFSHRMEVICRLRSRLKQAVENWDKGFCVGSEQSSAGGAENSAAPESRSSVSRFFITADGAHEVPGCESTATPERDGPEHSLIWTEPVAPASLEKLLCELASGLVRQADERLKPTLDITAAHLAVKYVKISDDQIRRPNQ